MKKLTNFLSSMLFPALIALVAFVAIASFTWKLAFVEPVPEYAAFDTNFYYSTEAVQEKYAWYNETQRHLYVRNAFTFDLAFPVLYVFLLLTAMAFFIKRFKNSSKLPLLYCIPLLTGISDVAENSVVSWIMLTGVTPIKSVLASSFTLSKWILLYLSIGTIGMLFATYIYKTLRERIAGQRH